MGTTKQPSGVSALQNEVILFNLECLTQGQFEDVLQFHRFNYYVKNRPVWSDTLYDQAEALLKTLFPFSVLPRTVGSSNASCYPDYVRDGRRPNASERADRDKRIAEANELFG